MTVVNDFEALEVIWIFGMDKVKSHFSYFHLDRSQSLFDFVPQEKGLIWRPLWGWKKYERINFFTEKMDLHGGKMHPNWCTHMPRIK